MVLQPGIKMDICGFDSHNMPNTLKVQNPFDTTINMPNKQTEMLSGHKYSRTKVKNPFKFQVVMQQRRKNCKGVNTLARNREQTAWRSSYMILVLLALTFNERQCQSLA